jgi:hypothetical protein
MDMKYYFLRMRTNLIVWVNSWEYTNMKFLSDEVSEGFVLSFVKVMKNLNKTLCLPILVLIPIYTSP